MELATVSPLPNPEARSKKKYSIAETFMIDNMAASAMVEGYESPDDLVPAIDPGFKFPAEETKMVLLALRQRDNLLITGPTGCGKDALIEQVAARLNINVVRINFDGCVTRQDLVGEWVVKNKEMEFQYGILLHAMKRPGTITLLSEWDAISPECAFVLQRPLERNDRRILLMEKGGELINMHPDNVIFATANTNGQGDDTGLYSHGTKTQNYAQVNRWSLTIRMDYMSPADEKAMLVRRFGDSLNHNDLANDIVQYANAIRNAATKGEISGPISTRDVINWTEKMRILADPWRSLKYTVVDRAPASEAQVFKTVYQHVFNRPAGP